MTTNIVAFPRFLAGRLPQAAAGNPPPSAPALPADPGPRNPLPRFMLRGSLIPSQAAAKPVRNGLLELALFVGGSQAACLRQMLRPGAEVEEAEGINADLVRLADIIAAMPSTHETEDIHPMEKVAHLHYFGGAYDAWIVEKDIGDDPEEPGQHQVYGLGCFTGGDPGLGYISLPELFKSNIELDFHFEPTPIRIFHARHDGRPVIRIETIEGISPQPRGDGMNYFRSYQAAFDHLIQRSLLNPVEPDCYTKTGVRVTFPSGLEWEYRYDLGENGCESDCQQDDFLANLHDRLAFRAGYACPDHLKDAEYAMLLSETPDLSKHARKILEKDFPQGRPEPLIRTATAGQAPGRLAQPDLDFESDLPASAAGPHITPALQAIADKQKEFLAMADGWQPGAIAHCSWGYDQTNATYYVIVARTPSMVEVKRIEYDLVEGSAHHSGKAMPNMQASPVYNDRPATTRHKLRKGQDGKIEGITCEFGFAALWDASPDYVSFYA